MFVDEGFGSLDEDALDQAIRALKDLSQGSRLVGIVSHVAELKERIDKKIIVTKKRTEDGVGSTICIEGWDFMVKRIKSSALLRGATPNNWNA